MKKIVLMSVMASAVLMAGGLSGKSIKDLSGACDKGIADSCYQVGMKLLQGDGTPSNIGAGVEMLEKGCKLKHSESCKVLKIRKESKEAVEIKEAGKAVN